MPSDFLPDGISFIDIRIISDDPCPFYRRPFWGVVVPAFAEPDAAVQQGAGWQAGWAGLRTVVVEAGNQAVEQAGCWVAGLRVVLAVDSAAAGSDFVVAADLAAAVVPRDVDRAAGLTGPLDADQTADSVAGLAAGSGGAAVLALRTDWLPAVGSARRADSAQADPAAGLAGRRQSGGYPG